MQDTAGLGWALGRRVSQRKLVVSKWLGQSSQQERSAGVRVSVCLCVSGWVRMSLFVCVFFVSRLPRLEVPLPPTFGCPLERCGVKPDPSGRVM